MLVEILHRLAQQSHLRRRAAAVSPGAARLPRLASSSPRLALSGPRLGDRQSRAGLLQSAELPNTNHLAPFLIQPRNFGALR